MLKKGVLVFTLVIILSMSFASAGIGSWLAKNIYGVDSEVRMSPLSHKYLTAQTGNPPAILINTGHGACADIGRFCAGLEYNCKNIGEVDEWKSSSASCGRDFSTSRPGDCLYWANCADTSTTAQTANIKYRVKDASTGVYLQGATIVFKLNGVTKSSRTTSINGYTISSALTNGKTYQIEARMPGY